MVERVRLPADVELEDRLAFGLTARQLLLLGAAALAAYGLYSVAAPLVPLPVAVAAAAPVAIAGALLALGRLEGLPADRLALAALGHLRSPRRRVLAPAGLPAPLRGVPAPPRLAPLALPVRAILRSGVVELAPLLALLQEQAAALPVPALATAAEGHLRFLAGLAAREGVRRREILLVLVTRARERETAQAELERRAGEARDLLRAAGVELRPLLGEQAAALLGRALDRPGPPHGAALEGVVRAC